MKADGAAKSPATRKVGASRTTSSSRAAEVRTSPVERSPTSATPRSPSSLRKAAGSPTRRVAMLRRRIQPVLPQSRPRRSVARVCGTSLEPKVASEGKPIGRWRNMSAQASGDIRCCAGRSAAARRAFARSFFFWTPCPSLLTFSGGADRSAGRELQPNRGVAWVIPSAG